MEADDMHMNELRLRVNPFLFSKATAADLGWFAGAVDFDGSFGIGVEWKPDGGVKEFAPRLTIINTNPLVFHKMHAMGLEVRVNPQKRVMKDDGSGLRKQNYIARLYPKDMRLVLPRILDHLAAKRAQGDLMLETLGLLETPKSEERDKRLFELHEGIKALNQKEWPLEAWP